MKVARLLIAAALCAFICGLSRAVTALEPFTYSQDFETGELSAWASYPLWQDTAWDPNMQVTTVVPGDPNRSLQERVTPYTHVDVYAGAQKKLDMYLVPGSTVSLRFYLKTAGQAKTFTVRLAAGPDGKADYTVQNPAANRWVPLTLGFDDFLRGNPALAGKSRIRVNALAVLACFPDADPETSSG